MFYAVDASGVRIQATPKAAAQCPCCLTPVRAKCGQLISWHWAHVEQECDPFSEIMTEWHRQWQAEFPEVCREFVVPLNGQTHRADVLSPVGVVIEFQHSSISPEEIQEREAFYPRMLWVFDTRNAAAWTPAPDSYAGNNVPRLDIRGKRPDGYRTFRWKHPRKTVAVCKAPVFLDLGEGQLLKLGRLYLDEPPYGGWGYRITRGQFVATMTGVAA